MVPVLRKKIVLHPPWLEPPNTMHGRICKVAQFVGMLKPEAAKEKHPRCAIIVHQPNTARVVKLVDSGDSKNLFTLEKQAAARGYARVKKVSYAM